MGCKQVLHVKNLSLHFICNIYVLSPHYHVQLYGKNLSMDVSDMSSQLV